MQRKMLSTVTAAAVALAIGTGLAAAQAPKKGGELNFSVVAEPPNYDCHGSTTFALIHPIAPHYSLLVKFDGKDYPKVIPDLAESWTVAPDGMTYTFKIRSGVKFHDGSPLTSEDIKATYDRIIKPPQGVVSIRKAYYSDLDVSAPNPTTVVFKLKNPMAGVLEALASPFNCIYSAAKLKQNPRYPETEIMGTGAFTFVEHVKGSHLGRQALRRLLRAGQALSRRLQGLLREVERRRSRHPGRSVRRRVPRPQPVREGPAARQDEGQPDASTRARGSTT